MRDRIKQGKVADSEGYRSIKEYKSEAAKAILERCEKENPTSISSFSMFIYSKKHAEQDIHPREVRCFGKWIAVHKNCCFAALEGMTCRM